MGIAEHVTVFISIIVGLAVADMLMSFHKLLRVRHSVRWHWLPLAVALFMVLLIVTYWWLAFTWYQSADKLSVAAFMPTLLQFVLLFLLAAASLPDDVPAEGVDLRAWYFDNSKLYWTLAALSLLVDIFVDGARHLGPGDGLRELLQAKLNDLILLPFLLLMIFTKRSWYHGAYILIGLANMTWLTVSVALTS